MSSRHPPSGENRYTPRDRDRDRDRSPYRLERRGSITSGPTRGQENSYRPGDASSRDVPAAPRGPSGRGSSYTSRGGNYIGREGRGGREPQFYRDRDFQRRDNDRRSSPNRNRSRTPPSSREYRDSRDAPLRNLDMTRVTRDARDSGPLSAASVSSEAGSSGSNFPRNSFRSTRGRGDWDRDSGRRNFDNSFRPRSRSRDRWDRDHDRGRDHDRDSRRDDDTRDRDNDRARRDPPVRPDSRNSVVSQPTSTGGGTGYNERRDAPKPPHFAETPRRASFAQVPARPDLSRRPSSTQTPSSPVQYPQVPEFGVIKPSTISPDAPKSATGPSPKDEMPPSFKTETTDPTKIAPRGPRADRADLAVMAPTAPKGFVRRPGFPEQSPVARRFDGNHDAPSIPSPIAPRFGPSGSPSFAHTPIGTVVRPRTNNVWTSPDMIAKSAQGSVASSENRSPLENDPHRPADIKIPTGPRADRDGPVRAPPSARSTWQNPSRPLPPHKPSIMQSMHSRKDDEHFSRPAASSPVLEMRPGSRSMADGEAAARRPSSDMTSARRSILSPGSTASAIQGLRGKNQEEDDNADAMDDEDEDEEDDEDTAELDQQDFEKSEIKFKERIESLQSKLAPEPSLNPKILDALESILIYASAIEDYKNGYVPPPKSVSKEKPRGSAVLSPKIENRPIEILTPPAEATQVKHEDDKADIEEFTMIDLPLDGLIYLDKNRLTPASFDFDDTDAEEDDLCLRVRDTLALDSGKDEQLRDLYVELYLKWREEVDAIDEENAQQEAIVTRAATPMSTLGTETATTPVPEGGRRTTRNATEMDIERVMKESAEEAQAAEMAQLSVDMSVDPDMTREAEIPDMLTEVDQEIFMFEDLNNRIQNTSDIMTATAPEDHPVFKAYNYLPPPDDFDSDDQERFMDAYAKFPKQWGFLAKNMNEAVTQAEFRDENQPLPKRRDYHQCIFHYYMTKKQAKPAYKLLPNRKSRPKKKAGAGGRRANQRSSMLGGNEEGGVRMTDTGRPKRAAAPNFNDKEKREAEVLAQKAALKEKKATTLLNKPVTDGASGSEKTPQRKTRKKGEKTAKRGVRIPGAAPNILPAQGGDNGLGGNAQLQNAYGSQDLEGAQLLAELHGYAGGSDVLQPPVAFSKGTQNEIWRIDPRVQGQPQPPQAPGTSSMTSQAVGMSLLDTATMQRQLSASAQEGVFPVRQPSPQVIVQPASSNNDQTTGSRGQDKISSYWSVPEKSLFEEALKRHGKNWPTIARYLPQKTETMCENFFKKGNKSGNDLKYEELAAEAEQRIAKEGQPQPLEPLPRSAQSSNSAPRRRGAPASQRALAPNPDPSPEVIMAVSNGADAHGVPSSALAQAPPQNTSHPRIAPARQIPVSAPIVTEALPAAKAPAPPQPIRTQPSVMQGPPQTSPYAPHVDLDRHRNIVPTASEPVQSSQVQQSKRPRSISENDRPLQEQPPKRQGISPEEFAERLALQHEKQQQQVQHVQQQLQYVQPPQAHPQHQQQPPQHIQQQQPVQQQPPSQQPPQQQRNIHRSDSQQGYDYRQPQSVSQVTYPTSMRTTSNTDEFDRYSRPRSPRPRSPNQYHKEREAYAVQQYRQEAPPPSTNSMAGMMGGVRSFEHSPRQHAQAEVPRPSSIAPPVSSIPAPPVQKRSNIMSLLNNDPPEEKKAVTESRPLAPSRHDPPTSNAPIHQSAPQQIYPRREVVDLVRENHSQRGYSQPVYATPATQPQSYNSQPSQAYMHPSQHQLQAREPYQQRPYYPETGRSHEPPRQMYQQASSAISPPPAHDSAYRLPRQNYDAPSHTHVGSSSAHSRATSYSMQSDSSVTNTGPLGPGSSRFASIRPSNPPQPMSHHQPAMSQHPIYHPGNIGHTSMTGTSRAANAYPGQLGHEHRRAEDQPGMRIYGTPPSHTPPNAGYGGYPPPPPS